MGAYLLDTLVLVVPLIVIVVVALAAGNPEAEDDNSWAVIGIAYMLTLVLPFVYYTVMHGRASGQTLGKKWLGIAVQEDSAGGSIGYGRAFGRYAIIFVLAIFILPILLDYLWPLWDRTNQALHDKIAAASSSRPDERCDPSRPGVDPADAAAVELAHVDEPAGAVDDDRARQLQRSAELRPTPVGSDADDVVEPRVRDVDRAVGPRVDADRCGEAASDRRDDPRRAVDAPDDPVVAVGDDDGSVGEDIEPVWRSEGGEPRGAAIAGIALSADPAERVDPSVGRHDPDAVVVLRDVEVPAASKAKSPCPPSCAEVAGPPSPASPRVPFPAIGVLEPSGSNRQIRPSSAT